MLDSERSGNEPVYVLMRAFLDAQVAYNALSAGVKTQLPLPPMSPDSAVPASSEPAAIPANRPFDPAQVICLSCLYPCPPSSQRQAMPPYLICICHADLGATRSHIHV